jgi:hypothetical protein
MEAAENAEAQCNSMQFGDLIGKNCLETKSWC